MPEPQHSPPSPQLGIGVRLTPAPWLTPVVIPAMLVLLGATALIYTLAAR